jgi:hypothetical protein
MGHDMADRDLGIASSVVLEAPVAGIGKRRLPPLVARLITIWLNRYCQDGMWQRRAAQPFPPRSPGSPPPLAALRPTIAARPLHQQLSSSS